MSQRDTVYRKFGPLMLEALFDNMLEEINELRTRASLPARPKDQFLGSAHNHLSHLEPYDWMETEPP